MLGFDLVLDGKWIWTYRVVMVGVHVGDDTGLGRFIFGLLIGHLGWWIAGVANCSINVYSRCVLKVCTAYECTLCTYVQRQSSLPCVDVHRVPEAVGGLYR